MQEMIQPQPIIVLDEVLTTCKGKRTLILYNILETRRLVKIKVATKFIVTFPPSNTDFIIISFHVWINYSSHDLISGIFGSLKNSNHIQSYRYVRCRDQLTRYTWYCRIENCAHLALVIMHAEIQRASFLSFFVGKVVI
jgi:hypothetical protein